MPQIPMTVCQTCGVEGYSLLLIHCLQCKIVAAHRYCIDGPPNLDDDEVIWSCEDCVPRKPEPAIAIRKSERMFSLVDREAQRRQARRNWRNKSSTPIIEKSNCVGNKAEKVVDDASNLEKSKSSAVRKRAKRVADEASDMHESINGTVERKQRKLPENGIARYTVCPKIRDSEPAPVIRQNKRILNSDDALDKKLSESSLLTGQKTKDCSKKGVSEQAPVVRHKKKTLNSNDAANKKSSEPSLVTGKQTKDWNFLNADENLQTEEKNLGSQLFRDPFHNLERTFNFNEGSDRDSVTEKLHKHEKSFSEVHSSLLEEQLEVRSSLAAEQPVDADYIISDIIEETKAVSDSHQRGDKQSRFDVYEIQTPRKKRRLVIAMEFSASDEEPVEVKVEDPQISPEIAGSIFHMSSVDPPVKIGENDIAHHSIIKSETNFPTQLSPLKADNCVLTQATSMEFDNCIVSHLSPAIFHNHALAQPILNAVWRGHCSVRYDVQPMSFGLEAHLSTKAHGKVHGAASALPNFLRFELVKKHCAWPKSFDKSPPTGDTIGLYFFPVDERDEQWYEYLLDEMIECNLVLKCHINSLELLAFCSQELPREERRFRSKYYLWGVFKKKEETSSTSRQPDTEISDTMYHRNTCKSQVSPSSSIGNISAINSLNSNGRYEAGKRFVERKPSIISKHPKPISEKQGYSSPLESRDCDNLARRNDDHRTRDARYPYSNAHERTLGFRHSKPIGRWKDFSFRRSSHSHDSYRSCKR